VKRDVQSVVLVLLGGALLRLELSGAYLNYVKSSLGRWLLVAGVVLVALGLWSAVRDVFRRDPAHALAEDEDGLPHEVHDHPDDTLADADDDGHGHRPGGPRIAWLLLAPVLTIFLVAPPALGAFSASHNATSIPQPPPSGLPPLPAGNPVPIAVSDYSVRAVWDSGKTLAGRTFSMVGFVTKAPGGGWYLTRLQISCCAADATPFKIKAMGAPDLPSGTWVHVVGRWVPGGGTMRDDAIPNVAVSTVTQVPQPANPYE
jgi:uncharacterized repeat protein (TIGR03943 family)